MAPQNSIPTYKALYNYIAVLDEKQVHKLHKVVSGVLNISVFSAEEIEQLQRKLSSASINLTFIPMYNN